MDNEDNILNKNCALPENAKPLSHQVAGHFCNNPRTKLGNLFFFSKLFTIS